MKAALTANQTVVVRCRGFTDRADRPIGRDPLPRRMREQGRQPDERRLSVDRCGLHNCEFIFAQHFADNIGPSRNRRIPERPIGLSREGRANSRDQGLFRIGELRLGFGQSTSDGTD